MDVLGELLLAAAAIAVVAYTDVIVTARAFAGDQRVDANRELTALGATDVIGGIFGAYPISASSSRTAIARMNGATSRFYSWVVAVVLVLTALLLSGLLSHLPQASLGGIILYAAWTLVDRTGWRSLRRMRWGEVVVAASCAIGVVVLGHPPGHRDRDRALGDRAAHPAVAPPRGRARLRARARRHARRRRLPRRGAGAGARGLPLRLAAVLRQLQRLLQPVPRGGRHARAADGSC